MAETDDLALAKGLLDLAAAMESVMQATEALRHGDRTMAGDCLHEARRLIADDQRQAWTVDHGTLRRQWAPTLDEELARLWRERMGDPSESPEVARWETEGGLPNPPPGKAGRYTTKDEAETDERRLEEQGGAHEH